MKKILIVLGTVGAFTDVALAQSNVTLYGLVDLSYQHLSSGDSSPLAGQSLNRLADGSAFGPGSRWGLRVQEDLGNGLKANVVLESGFAGDTGVSANGGRLFGRQAFISLASATLGEIRLGRQYAFHDEVTVLNNPYGNSLVTNPAAVANTFATGSIPLFIDAPRIDNTVQYISPTFYGLRLQAMVAAGEGLVDRYQGLKGTFANGPLNLALSYEQSKARVATPGVGAAGDAVNKIWEVGGNYDFGRFKLLGGYQNGKDLTTGSAGIITAPATSGGIGTQIATLTLPGLAGPATRLKAYTVGALMPVGAGTVALNYTRTKFENAAGSNRTLGRIGLVGTYSLSKLTTVYTGIGVSNGDLKDFINEKRVFQLGLRKTF
ncbi:porin [Azohydromonas australica]|uniref:porin n=1 Tax=Azohydromonas australica TaxID=364039 RepID=UPI0009FBAB1E|nr:porin [Azohydromonas australica]